MGARHLAIGLDGADLGLVRKFGRDALPELHRLMDQGAYAALQSVQPPATLPNWTTFLTGVNPGRHGVFDFTTRHGYDVRFTAGSVREVPTVMARLDRLGKSCACLGFPATWPPERLQHGVFVSGWDAPVAFEADRSFVWPPALHDELRARFGPMRFDEVDEFDTDGDFHVRLPDALCERVQRKLDLLLYLLEGRDWELFAAYFGESDTAAHHLWALHDADSPRRPPHVTEAAADGLRRVYSELDRALGKLRRAAGDDVEITIVSDHGFGGASDKVLYLNQALSAAGLLSFAPRAAARTGSRGLKEWALTRLPPRTRERIFRAGGAVLPSWLESRARFARIDMRRTLVFSDELNYFPGVHLNLRGREPQGCVDAADADAVLRHCEQALRALRDPWTDAPVVRNVWRRQALYAGPHVARAPELVLDLSLDAGYSYNLMPSPGEPGAATFARLDPADYLGRKGRSLQGSHREHGLYVAAGPSVRAVGQVQLGMADATATLLTRMGIDATGLEGVACGRLLRRNRRATGTALPQADLQTTVPAHAGQGRVADRLRKLGYIE